MTAFNTDPLPETAPARITFTHEGEAVIIRLSASAMLGKIGAVLGLLALVGVPLLVLQTNESLATFTNEPGGRLALAVYGGFALLFAVFLLMRGFNVTTIHMTPDGLTRRVAPFSFGQVKLTPDEMDTIVIRMERPGGDISKDDGIRIYPFTVAARGPDKKRKTIKNSVRGRRHALYLALAISHTYGLRSVDSLRERLADAENVPSILRRILD